VALARALVLEPEVLLLDEPLSSLDRKLRKEMQIELRRIQREVGITFIYVTHDQKEAISMSDRIAIMKEGRIVQVGTPREIFERPKTAFVAEFMGATNLFSGQLIQRNGQFCLETPSGLLLAISPEMEPRHADGPQMLALRPEAIEIYATDEDPPSQNCFVARVLDVTYLGETMEFEVLLHETERLKIHSPSRSALAKLRVGERVLVRWDPERTCLVRPD
jgi:ABC-type Fe3+/spermidine/putrescine transport system ATPase subunit